MPSCVGVRGRGRGRGRKAEHRQSLPTSPSSPLAVICDQRPAAHSTVDSARERESWTDPASLFSAALRSRWTATTTSSAHLRGVFFPLDHLVLLLISTPAVQLRLHCSRMATHAPAQVPADSADAPRFPSTLAPDAYYEGTLTELHVEAPLRLTHARQAWSTVFEPPSSRPSTPSSPPSTPPHRLSSSN